ncbi:MAG: DUF167 family protein [Candidatus Omnitrophica bacterium]|nr:DUF167 family protein [Candidatus Omnitrophota bacterium]
MYYVIKVTTHAAHNEVIRTGAGDLIVKTTATPERGKANKKVLALLAEFFAVPPSRIQFVKGKYTSRKLIHITADPGRPAKT